MARLGLVLLCLSVSLAVVLSAHAKNRKLRRHADHDHTGDDYMGNALKWLNDEQRTELAAFKKAPGTTRKQVNEKILSYFRATKGDLHTQAEASLKGACRHVLVDLFGEEKAGELKQLKESGAGQDAILAKIQEWSAGLATDEQKSLAADSKDGCEEVFGHQHAAAGRKRRAHRHLVPSN